MSFSISPEYYNVPRMNTQPVKIIQEEKVDENGVTFIEERIVPDDTPRPEVGGNRISSVPFITGGAYDYQ